MALGQQGQLGQLQHVSWVNNNTTTAGSCTYYSVLNIFLPQYLRLHGAARLVTGYISEQFPWWRPAAALSAMVPIFTLACDYIRPGPGHTGQWSQETGHWSAPSSVVRGTSCPPCPAPALELATNLRESWLDPESHLSILIFADNRL